MKKIALVSLACLLALLLVVPVQAQPQQNMATNPICADLTGQASSICTRAVAAGCTEDASSEKCQGLEADFTQLTGEEPYWVCPCFTSSLIDQTYSSYLESYTIIGYWCGDTNLDDFIYVDMFPFSSYCSSGGSSRYQLATVWWAEGGANDDRWCEGPSGGDINDLNFYQAHACRQAILGSTTWQDFGCPGGCIWPYY
jgi:hypothetical protein